jgi:hypothetical protein
MMNERIKELAKQAGAEIKTLADGTDYQSLYKEDGTGFDLEKFAQLLINECYNRAEKQYHHSSDEWDKAVMAVMDSIDELFGVEE